MATISPRLTNDKRATSQPISRYGGPRNRRASAYEQRDNYRTSRPMGSHMPLDTEAHWTWRNPLNIIPATLIVIVLLGLIGALI